MPVVDRICGDSIVAENDDGHGRMIIPCSLVRGGVCEGDVIVLKDGFYEVETENTQKNRESNYRLSESLWDN